MKNQQQKKNEFDRAKESRWQILFLGSLLVNNYQI